MNYEERFKEALAKAREYWNSSRTCIGIDALVEIFPELKEYKNERIRNEIILFLREGGPSDAAKRQEWANWLEKQGEQKTADPKFKVGDWLTSLIPSLASPVRVLDIYDNYYRFEKIDGSIGCQEIQYVEEHWREWTTDDAKEGEILVTPMGSIFIYKSHTDVSVYDYCSLFLNYFRPAPNDNSPYAENNKIRPADKYERDRLFSKMKENGFRWDSEKKQVVPLKTNSKIKKGKFYKCIETHKYGGTEWLEGRKYYAPEDNTLMNQGQPYHKIHIDSFKEY